MAEPTRPSSPSDPPIPVRDGDTVVKRHDDTVNNDTGTEQLQMLGGRTYRIDTSQLLARMNKTNPLWKKALLATTAFLATPVIVPTVALYTLSMYIGPSWWRNKAAFVLVTRAMKRVGDLFDEDRKELLQGIGSNEKILDLGAGSGYYLKYLCRGRHLVALEPVSNFHEGYRNRAIEGGMEESQVEMHACDIEAFIREFPKQRATFDWIILGNVLCEVDDQISTLRCVHQLLKPGGHVYFSEHIGMPKGTWSRHIQDLINPVWRTVAAGCNCNRDSLLNIRTTKGWQVISWKYFAFNGGLVPFVLGLAMKDDQKKVPRR